MIAENNINSAVEGEKLRILARLETDRYNKEVLPELHKCVLSQVQNGWYDCEINLAILKLYQFHPDESTVDTDIMIKILIKAMMNLPEADFLLASYLIPEPYQNLEEVQHLALLVEKLEMAQFKEFWLLYREKAGMFNLFPTFEQSIRTFILNTLSLTYALVPRRVLCESLNVKESDLDDIFPREACEGMCV